MVRCCREATVVRVAPCAKNRESTDLQLPATWAPVGYDVYRSDLSRSAGLFISVGTKMCTVESQLQALLNSNWTDL